MIGRRLRAGTTALALAVLCVNGGRAFAATAARDSVRAPEPATGLVFADVPEDAGRALDLAWTLSPDDRPGLGRVTRYVMRRATDPAGPWTAIDTLPAGCARYRDGTVRRNTSYFYRLVTLGPGGATPSGAGAGPAIARSEWWRRGRGAVLVVLAAALAVVALFVRRAREQEPPPARDTAGLAGIEAALARAAAMGRSMLYVPGIRDIDDPQTLAALSLLDAVARRAAAAGVTLCVPVAFPVPFTIAEASVRAAYAEAGRLDALAGGGVRFVSPEQFAFAGAVAGDMRREGHAAHVLMGAFFGEALLLAETGTATGAYQVAGTASPGALPYFAAACEHVLVGEELYAAGPALAGDAPRIGSLRGSDALLLALALLVLVGCALETCGIHALTAWLRTR